MIFFRKMGSCSNNDILFAQYIWANHNFCISMNMMQNASE